MHTKKYLVIFVTTGILLWAWFVAAQEGTVGGAPRRAPVDVQRINNVVPLMGNGVTGTGSQRVTIASDNTAFSVNIGTFPDNEPINVAQINGVTVLMGNGATGTGSQRVTIASDNTPFPIKIDQTTPGTTNKVNADVTHVGGAAVTAMSLGQQTASASLSVVTASNQAALPLPATIDVTVTPTITAGAYDAGDSLGGELTFASVVRNAGGGGTIMGVVVTVLANVKPSTSFDLIFFQANPATAVDDNAALDIVDADMDDICARVQIRSTDYTQLSDNEFAVKAGIGMPFDLDSGSDLYCYVLINDADTFDSQSDVIIKLVVAPD